MPKTLLLLSLLVASAFAQGSGAPVVTSLSPNGVMTGPNGASIEILGSNFVSGDMVQWTGPGGQTTTLTPVFQTPQEMSLSLPASLTTTSGTAQLSLVNGSAVSNTVTVPLAPFSLFSITPAKASAGSSDLPVSTSGREPPATTLVFTPPGGTPVNIPLGAGGTATIPASALGTSGAATVALSDSQGNLSDSLPFTVLPSITPTVVLTSSVNPAVIGQAVTLTASVAPGAASGTVVFFDGATILGSTAIRSGQAALTTHLAGAGLRSLRAFYAGTASYAPASSAPLAETLHGVTASTFQPAVPYGTGKSPQAAVQADFNNDGKADLAVVNMTGNSVSVLIGNGDGSFQKHVDYGTDTQPQAIAAGDLNGDGNVDLVIASGITPPTVSVLLGNGDGTFQSATVLPVPPTQYEALDRLAVAITDMNGDGTPDIVINLITGQQIAVLPGNGDGTFQPPIYSAWNTTFNGIREGLVVGDFNGDGNVDVLVQQVNGSAGFYAMNGRGNGNLYSGTFFSALYDPFSPSLVTADFNGDGKTDVAASAQGGGIGMMLGDGTEHFTPKETQGSTGADGLAIGDFNGDGVPDLFQAGGGNVVVWEGNGDGTFAQAGTYATGNGSSYVVAGDFNGDGIVDLAVIDSSDSTINVLLGGTASGIQTITFPAIPDTPLSNGTVTVTATASSGLPVSFSSNTTSVCMVSGSTVTLVKTGTCEIVASQVGNANFAPATPVSESFSVEYYAQPPLPTVTGVANAASAGQATPWVVGPGSYVAIYGTNLAGSGNPNATPGSALPTTLNGAQVTMGGMPMPLLYAASGQINAVVPQGLGLNTAAPLQVVVNQVRSDKETISVRELQPGIYTVDTSGSGAGVVADALTGSLITASNPAHTGEYLVIYATGLGPLKGDDGSNEPADGAIAPSSPLYRTTSKITVSIGGVSAPVSFSGLTPTLTGLYQINVQMPAGVAAGNAATVVVTASDSVSGATAVSNMVTIAAQ